LPLSLPLGGAGGRLASCLACFALWASPVPDEFFFGFLSPMELDSLLSNSLVIFLEGQFAYVRFRRAGSFNWLVFQFFNGCFDVFFSWAGHDPDYFILIPPKVLNYPVSAGHHLQTSFV
jgi:hypothetical protein